MTNGRELAVLACSLFRGVVGVALRICSTTLDSFPPSSSSNHITPDPPWQIDSACLFHSLTVTICRLSWARSEFWITSHVERVVGLKFALS